MRRHIANFMVTQPLLSATVFLIKLVDATGRVNKFHFAGVERMGFTGNFQLHQRIFITIFPHDGFFCRNRRTGEKGVITGEILEYNKTVIVRMNVVFHNPCIWMCKGRKTEWIEQYVDKQKTVRSFSH